MAVTKITYDNKEAIQNDVNVERKNKVTDTDMNEIKQVVNNNADELEKNKEESAKDISNLKSKVSEMEKDNTTNKSNIEELQKQVKNKVDKIEGKDLSSNDFTDEDKKKLEELTNYNDKEIKEDISNIKQEQKEQDDLISKLQEENKQIKEALINIETEESKSIHIKDGDELPSQLEVSGNVEQETQEGTSNLAILEKQTSTQSGVTVIIENGNINVDGTNTTSNTLTFAIGKVNLIKDQTYYLRRQGNTTGTGLYVNNKGTQVWGNATETFFVANETGLFDIRLTVGTVTINNITQQVLISKTPGTEWVEGKAEIPSPYNHSEIKCLGSNKNLFDKNSTNFYNNNSSEFENTNNNVSTRVRTSSFEIGKGTYTISGLINKVTLVGIRTYNVNKEQIEESTRNGNTFILGENVKYIHLLFGNTDGSNLSKEEVSNLDLKIEKGTEATSYSPYRTRKYRGKENK